MDISTKKFRIRQDCNWVVVSEVQAPFRYKAVAVATAPSFQRLVCMTEKQFDAAMAKLLFPKSD